MAIPAAIWRGTLGNVLHRVLCQRSRHLAYDFGMPDILVILLILLLAYTAAGAAVIGHAWPLFLLFTHRSNVQRLCAGTDSRFERARLLARRWAYLGGLRHE